MTDTIVIEASKILGFEPYFEQMVTIAMIHPETKEIYPTHGYFPPHRYGKKVARYAKRIGFTFNTK